jgi:hypothetical protein
VGTFGAQHPPTALGGGFFYGNLYAAANQQNQISFHPNTKTSACPQIEKGSPKKLKRLKTGETIADGTL